MQAPTCTLAWGSTKGRCRPVEEQSPTKEDTDGTTSEVILLAIRVKVYQQLRGNEEVKIWILLHILKNLL